MFQRTRVELATGAMAVILVGACALGFALPDELSLTSGAPAYNLFHLAFGLVAAACFLLRSEPACRAFALGFGLIDLYQALAHVLGGGALVAVALVGRPRAATTGSPSR